MNRRDPAIRRVVLISSLMLAALPGVGLAQPLLNSFSFAPASINTAAGPASVTVSFSATDTSNINYFEMAFIDPSGIFIQRGFKNLTPSTNVTDSVTVSFPRFSTSGTWKVLAVFLADNSGNTTFLDTAGVAGLGFPTDLVVSSAVDNTPPNITAFSFTPATIDTTAASAAVTVNFTLTDDLAGANTFQAVFTSPSGNVTQTASKTFTAALTVTDSGTLTFPQFSEAGTWTVSSVFVADAAGNTLILAPPDLAARSFPTTLTVTSTTDSTPPTLTAFSFTPTSINVTGAPASVTFSFQATDDISGVTNFQADFISPSGLTTQNASASFTVNTSASGSATATFPKGSENGTWTVANVFLSDAAGNTRNLATADLAGLTFPTQLTVINASGDTTPPVIVATVNPPPNAFGWNTTVPVSVSWSVTDPESGITSSSGCGTSSLSAETAGVTFTCSAVNGAGLTNSVSVTVRIDLTPPIVTPSVSPAPTAAGWNNTNVTVSWNVSDPTSGINSEASTGCDPAALTTETAGTTFTCNAVNGAGLTRSASVTVKIDMTPPTATAAASPAPNGAGWNSTNVTVTFTGADSLSGIASCTAPITLSTEGPGQTASGLCTDNAGNVSATATVSGINIDKTPPVVVPSVSPAPNGAGWNTTSPVTVTWSVTDPSPGSSVTSSTGCTTSTVTAETAGTTFTCTATNIAGLTTTNSVTVKLDISPPVVAGSLTPAPNAAGWNNSNVTVAWSATDPISGIASSTGCAPATVSTETTGTVFTCTATNGAGLTTSASLTVKLDKTAPVASNVHATPSAIYINNGTSVTATITDSLSGVASAQYNIDGGSFIAMTGTFGGSTANVSAATPVFTTTGVHHICVQGTDVAGNTGATSCGTVAVFTAAAPSSGTTCNGAYNGTFNGTIVVSNGQVCDYEGTVTGSIQQSGGTLILLNATVGGSVQITNGGSFSINTSTINGSLQIVNLPTGTVADQVCGTHVKASLQVTNNGTPVYIGAVSSCAGNNIAGSLQVQSNHAQTLLIGNTVAGSLQDNNNVTTGSPATQVTNNIISSALQCSGNSSIVGGGNTASVKQGQCSAF